MVNTKCGTDKFFEKLMSLKSKEEIKIGEYTFWTNVDVFGTLYPYSARYKANCKGSRNPKDRFPRMSYFKSYEELHNWLDEEDRIRVCSECGMPMQEGWIFEGAFEYYCSEECYTAESNRCWGVGNWRVTEEENAAEGYLDYFIPDTNEWVPQEFYFTDWYGA